MNPKTTFPPEASMEAATQEIRNMDRLVKCILGETSTLALNDNESVVTAELFDALTWIIASVAQSNGIAALDMIRIISEPEFIPETTVPCTSCVLNHDDAVRASGVLYARGTDCKRFPPFVSAKDKLFTEIFRAAGKIVLEYSARIASHWSVTSEELADDLQDNGYAGYAACIEERRNVIRNTS